ncbi:MAG: SpoIIE family protein phosphatase [Aquisalimonadaceae bacterium]
MPDVEYAAASVPCEGEDVCGDRMLFASTKKGFIFGVVDAIGHGKDAAVLSDAVIDTIGNSQVAEDAEDYLPQLFKQCHERLRQTRGAALSLAVFDVQSNAMQWLGIGNVSGMIISRDRSGMASYHPLLVQSGVVGDRLAYLKPVQRTLRPGDTFIVTTDGIRPSFADRLPTRFTPRSLANHIIDTYRMRRDDALVLVARYRKCGHAGNCD